MTTELRKLTWEARRREKAPWSRGQLAAPWRRGARAGQPFAAAINFVTCPGCRLKITARSTPAYLCPVDRTSL